MRTKELGIIKWRRYPGLNGNTRSLVSDKELELLNQLSFCLELQEKTRIEQLTKEIKEVQQLQKKIIRGIQFDL